MEDLKKLLEQNEVCVTSSSDENDPDSMSSVWRSRNNEGFSFSSRNLLELKCSNSTSKKRNGEKRLPTRKPDPNVYNRNALLARENRRKKKVYLETIEKELHVARKANCVLAKALKRQLKIAQRLEKEKKYFENLVRNRSDMLTLVNALNLHHIPEFEKSPFSVSSNQDEDFIYNAKRDGTSTGSLNSILHGEDSLSIEFDSPSDDLDIAPDTSLPTTSTTWDNIWVDKNYNIDSIIATNLSNHNMPSFNDDHCYVSTSSIKMPERKSESSDYVDVEADSSHIGAHCLNSNWNSACPTPPQQLLSYQSS